AGPSRPPRDLERDPLPEEGGPHRLPDHSLPGGSAAARGPGRDHPPRRDHRLWHARRDHPGPWPPGPFAREGPARTRRNPAKGAGRPVAVPGRPRRGRTEGQAGRAARPFHDRAERRRVGFLHHSGRHARGRLRPPGRPDGRRGAQVGGSSMKPARIGADFKVVFRSYSRNPVALFFSLIFPIILIGLFGLIFSSIGSTSTTLIVLNEDHNSVLSVKFLAALNDTKIVTVQTQNVAPSDFAAWLGQNGYSAGMIVPTGFENNSTENITTNLSLYLNPQDSATEGEVLGAVQGVAASFNLEAKCAHLTNCTPEIGLAPLHNVGSQTYSYIDYLIPGLIGFSILTSPMF